MYLYSLVINKKKIMDNSLNNYGKTLVQPLIYQYVTNNKVLLD